MDVCCNTEWGGEEGWFSWHGVCEQMYASPKLFQDAHARKNTHARSLSLALLIGFSCFLDDSIVFSGIRGGSCVYTLCDLSVCAVSLCVCVFNTAVTSSLVKSGVAKIAKQGHLF